MIVDFIDIKKQLQRLLNIRLREEVKKRAPFFASLKSHFRHEGNDATYETVDNKKQSPVPQEVEVKRSMTRDEMAKMTLSDIMDRTGEMAEEMAGGMERGLFQTMGDVIKKAGNDIKSRPTFADTFLDGLDKIQIDFDGSRDKPIMPTLVTHPDMATKIKEEEANQTNEQKEAFAKREKKIMDRQFKDYQEREKKRRLID